MMRSAKTLPAVAYLLFMVGIVLFSGSVIVDEYHEFYSGDWPSVEWRVLGNGGAAAVVALISAIYFFAFLRNSRDVLAILSYLFSCVVGGIVSNIVLESLGKASSPYEFEYGLVSSMIVVVPALIAIFVAVRWTYRRAIQASNMSIGAQS